MSISIQLTIFFDEPFYVGVFEKRDGGLLMVAKHIFGSLPSNPEIMIFILNHFHQLKFSMPIEEEKPKPSLSFKKSQKIVKKNQALTRIGTKSQQALKLQQEENKMERKTSSKKEKELEKEKMYRLLKEKHLKKHQGH